MLATLSRPCSSLAMDCYAAAAADSETIFLNFKCLGGPPRLVRSSSPSGYILPRSPPVAYWVGFFVFFQSVFWETHYWAPWSWAQCKCSRLGTSSLLKFGSFWISLGTYTISDATKKNLRSSNSDHDFIRNSLRCFACIWQSKICSKEFMAILGDIWQLVLDREIG